MHNRTYGEPVRIRLRVAVNVGPVMGDLLGMSGEVIIRATRLLDAPEFKSAMASTGARLGIIVSEFVYETTIRHAEGWTDPDKYESIQVTVKETSTHAWMQLIDRVPGQIQSDDLSSRVVGGGDHEADRDMEGRAAGVRGP
jgi:hypothetical protein